MSTNSNSLDEISSTDSSSKRNLLFSEYIKTLCYAKDFSSILSRSLARIYSRDLYYMTDAEFSSFALSEIGIDKAVVDSAITCKNNYTTPKSSYQIKM